MKSSHNTNRHSRMHQRLRQKQQYRTHIIMGSLILALTGMFSVYFLFHDPEQALAVASGDYRSKQTGSWSSSSSWQKYNGSSWVNASASPTDGDGVITIQNGHTITIGSGLTINQVIIDSGATVINNNGNLKISNGTGTDITVNGTLTLNAKITLNSSSIMAVYGTVNKNSGDFKQNDNSQVNVYNGGWFVFNGGDLEEEEGNWNFNAGSTYKHNVDGNDLPDGSWNATSTCLITGCTSSLPDEMDQNFGHFTFNCTGLTGNHIFEEDFENIAGDLRIISTGTGSITLNQSSNSPITIGGSYFHDGGTMYVTETGNCTVNIGGNMTVTSGTSYLTSTASSNGSGNPSYTIAGALTINGGTLDLSKYTGSNAGLGIGTINLSGDLRINAGELKESSTTIGKGKVNFQGTSTQQFVNNGSISNTIDCEIKNGAIVDLGSYIFSGTGNLTIASGSTVQIGSAEGITGSGNAGNSQVTGSRVYSSTASYRYNGTSTQVTGSGLPATVANIAFDNSSGVTLTNSVSSAGSVSLESGVVTTGSNSLTVGTSTSSTGSLSRTTGWVNGNLARWIPAAASGSFVFPVGVSEYNEYSTTFTELPSSPGLLTVSFIQSSPVASGLPLFESNSYKVTTIGSKGYWSISSSNGLSGGVYTISALGNGFTGISDLADVRLLSRLSSADPWSLLGTHAAGTGSISSPLATRTGVGLPQQITLGWGYNALPIELIAFDAQVEGKMVHLSWSTAAEINNEYFSLERSVDGINFEEIGQVRGSGNTTTVRAYKFYDEDPLEGESYYRLRQTDYDGKFEIFDPKHISIENKILDESKVTVWPNPFEDRFNVDIETGERAVVEITLLGMDGRTIRTEQVIMVAPGTRWTFTDGNDLLTGTYIIRLQVNDEVLSRKLTRK